MARRKNKTSLLDRVLGGKVGRTVRRVSPHLSFSLSRAASGPTTGASQTAPSVKTDVLLLLLH